VGGFLIFSNLSLWSDCTGTLLILKLWSSVFEGLWLRPKAAQRRQGAFQSTRPPSQWWGI